MEWIRCKPPSTVKACDCGSKYVEKRPDGLVKSYRCAECHAGLGDITMGHEP